VIIALFLAALGTDEGQGRGYKAGAEPHTPVASKRSFIERTKGMWSPLLIVLGVFLYVYAGHQTWWRMLLTDPQARDCPITADVRNGTLPFWVYAGFVALWLPLVILGWTAAKLS
jgi:hypothetical protein